MRFYRPFFRYTWVSQYSRKGETKEKRIIPKCRYREWSWNILEVTWFLGFQGHRFRLWYSNTAWVQTLCLPCSYCYYYFYFYYIACPTVVSQSPKSQHVGIYSPLHVISWPFHDIVSALTVVGHSLSLVLRRSTLCQMICETPLSAASFLCLSARLAH